ncbi:MAG TPA: HEAT repeat domain-containing protein [Syntrophorhabdaceae bacterium]|jgi:HEAT repeat protein|nr:HEAT repeat domain-containing protein [Syntrophorhabdaceae bacterium]OQC48977.1 MAG: HEAT repeat protein [Deltaproteobacteria bacterium ADurb.Bin026]HOG39599.1 HEAT repeat domain-containing protein [Syntrophorhabdaceae bacterium]HPN98390.1 HEAT repeat domain-containing protein [Syntrophorhabdaceae bacterium]HQG50578.1 HEAT repeat domain-containing protein [Syntrophorhabdaceae bacterium]
MTSNKGIARTKKISKLIKILINGDSFEKEKAMEKILSNPTPEAVEDVIRLLYLSETVVRMFAVDILKRIGHLNIQAIIKLLDDENEDVAIYACEILYDIKQKEAVPYLIRKLKEDSRVNVRNTACIALGEIGDESAVDTLIEVLRDDEWVEFSAIQSLGKIGSKKAVAPLLDIFENRDEVTSFIACEVLMGIGDVQIVDRVMSVLKSWDKKKRSDYIRIVLEEENETTFHKMREKMEEELFEHLLSIIKNEDKRSIKILKAIAEFKNIVACDVILDTFKNLTPDDDDYYERLKIFADLSDVWSGHAEQMLDKEEGCTLSFIKACAMSKTKIKESLLLEKLLNSSIEVKREIVKNIPVIVDGNGFSIIKKAMEDNDGHIKGDAVSVIGSIGAKEFMDKVTEVAKKGFFDMRQKALRTLFKLDRESMFKIIDEFVNEGTNDDKKLYLSIAPFLKSEDNYVYVERLISDTDDGVRKATINILGRFLDDIRYMELFKKILNGAVVPHEALKIIKERKLVDFRDMLINIFLQPKSDLWTRYYSLMALGAFNDPTLLNVFLDGLKDDNSLIKIGSLKALSNLDDRSLLDFVRPLTESPDEDVRSAAQNVIEKLEGI